MKLSEVSDTQTAQEQGPPSALGSFFRSLLMGAGQTAMGAAQLALGRRGAQPAARAPGEASAIGALGQRAAQQEQAFQQSPDVRAHPIASGIGRIAGETLPTLAIGGAPARSALGMIGQGALRGAAGGAMTPATGPPQDYWAEKAKQMGIGAAAGAALPAAGSAIAPRLLNPALQNLQGIQRAFRPLYNFVMGAEERTVNGFNRTIARQALDPIGRDIQRGLSGSKLLQDVETKISAAYDDVLPHITLVRGGLTPPNADFRRYVDTMSTDHRDQLGRLLKNYVFDRFDPRGRMDGQTYKRVQHELSQRAYGKLGTNDDELGRATYMALNWLNENIERMNPMHAPALSKANESYRLFSRMKDAAERRPTSESRFSPSDLLAAIAKSGTHAWRGDEPLQRYAQVGYRALQGGSSPMELLQHFTGHGARVALARASTRPAGRFAKAVGEPAAAAVGREAARKRTDAYDANRRGDLDEMQRLAQKRRRDTLTIAPSP